MNVGTFTVSAMVASVPCQLISRGGMLIVLFNYTRARQDFFFFPALVPLRVPDICLRLLPSPGEGQRARGGSYDSEFSARLWLFAFLLGARGCKPFICSRDP